MLRLSKPTLVKTAMVCAAVALAAPAQAACKKMGFAVNDYGKDGPSRDAQVLLDKHIAKWAHEQGINEYSVGKKTVECELYLNLILFDEHTCTASATVCWGGSKQPKTKTQSAKAKSKKSTATKNAKATPEKPASKVVKTVATNKQKTDSKPDKKADGKPASAATAPEQGSPIETSAIPRYVPDPKAPKADGANKATPKLAATKPATLEPAPAAATADKA
ncbi:MAG TPA: hypothetical protein VLA51_13110, partial [Paracoccaceae bacterium]|nr:hypothetical protein [Paracoccaceae bacterium]